MAIYLKLAENQKFDTLYDLLFYGFNQPSYCGKFVATYHDKDCRVLQCHVARRSAEDLLQIASTYFGTIFSAEELAETIVKLYATCGLAPYFCPDIQKLVFKKFSKLSFDHWVKGCWKTKIGKGIYSYNDLFKKLEEDGTI